MKKLTIVCAVLLTITTLLTACGTSLVGTWNATIEGEAGQMILNKDGTGQVISNGLTRPCTWKVEEDKLTVEQSIEGYPYVFLNAVSYSIEGKQLTVTSQSGNTLVFEKE